MPLRTLRHAPLFAVAVLATTSCGDADSPGGATPSGPVARFTLSGDATPNLLDVPFPTDAYLHDGHVIDPIPGFDAVFRQNAASFTHAFAPLDGFSRVALALFYVDDEGAPAGDDGGPVAARIDPASLPADETACAGDASAAFLVDLEADGADGARIPCRAMAHDDSARGSHTRPLLAVGPARGVVLDEGHRYAAVVTSRVRDRAGRAVAASADLSRIVSGDRRGDLDALYGDALDRASTLLGPALATDGARIVALAPFTTNRMTRELFQMRETVEDAPAATLAWDAASMAPMGAARFARAVNGQLPAGFTASLDAWLGVAAAKLPDGSDDPDLTLPTPAHDAIAAVGTAVFEPINFLVHTPGGYADPEHATLARDASGRIVPAPAEPTERVWLTVVVPTAPMPATGYPTVIVQHGMSDSRMFMMALANVFAAKGWVTVGIDSLTFGARAPEGKYQTDQHSRWSAAPGATYDGPDGFADLVDGATNGPLDLMGNGVSFGAMRDQFRQAEIDTAQLVALLRSGPDLSPLRTGPGAGPALDPGRIAYVGDSLGAIQGAVAAAIEPHVRSWVLNVPGGEFVAELATHAPLFQTVGTASGLLFGFIGDRFDESHPMMAIAQTLIDPGDPIAYAPLLVQRPGALHGVPLSPRNVLMTETVFDDTVPNEAAEALARAMGIGLALPNVGSNAGTLDLQHLDANRGRVPLADVAPDADGLIHDTPVAGTTAVVVQQSPGGHGLGLVASTAEHTFAIPFADFAAPHPFVELAPKKRFYVRTAYRELQATVTRFLEDGFAGRVPAVTGFVAPVRDYDDDGAADDTDGDPSDPSVQ